jgi:hypothetical protein
MNRTGKRFWAIIVFLLMTLGIGSSSWARSPGCDIDIKPKVLKSRCNKPLIRVIWDLPDGRVPADLTPESIAISKIAGYEVNIVPVSYQFKRHYDDAHLFLEYDCSEILSVVTAYRLTGEVLVEISGSYTDTTPFVGWDDIHVRSRKVR